MIITLSGTDGVGKSTQLQKILNVLENLKIDYRVMYVRGGRTPISKLYRNIILKHKSNNISELSLRIGFAIAMLELMYYWCIKIRLLEKKSRVIICDRYIWDTYVDFSHNYKSWTPNNLFWKCLSKGFSTPDVSILYVANAAIINERLIKKNEYTSWEDILLLNERYDALRGVFDYVVDASMDENEVFEKTQSILKDNHRPNDDARLYKRILMKVVPFLKSEDRYTAKIKKINKGNSTAHNYCIFIRNQPRYFVKIYDKKIKHLSQLQYLSKQNTFSIYPIVDFSIGLKRCMVTDWVDGEDISGTSCEAYQVAEILKSIHSLRNSKVHHKFHIKSELKQYLLYFAVHKVEFAHKQEIVSYLFKNATLCRSEYTLTHMDVHRRNFIIDSNNIVRLVDYENLCIADPWRDFVYACFFHDREEDLFLESVINNYFNDGIPEDFWITMKYYCYLHLLRMVICEHQKGNYENIDSLVKSIWENWNCNDNNLPKWRMRL